MRARPIARSGHYRMSGSGEADRTLVDGEGFVKADGSTDPRDIRTMFWFPSRSRHVLFDLSRFTSRYVSGSFRSEIVIMCFSITSVVVLIAL